MRAAFVIFDRMTALDFVGVYDPVTRLQSMGFLPDLTWDICAASERVTDDRGLVFTPTRTGEALNGYDLLIVPGGFGTRTLSNDAAFIEWLRTAADCKLKASVCTGALLLGAAGFLEGRRATTHRSAFQELAKYCLTVVDDRVVDEGDVVTARGVASALDLGLHLVERLAGPEAGDRIRRQMDYQPTAN
jgi:transcriptional regulator GlxA family with amidase domain